jgi:hypothetical protein
MRVLAHVRNATERERIANFLLPGDHYSIVAAFAKADKVVREQVLSLQCPTDTIPANYYRALEDMAILMKQEHTLNLHHVSAEDLLTVLIVAAANVYGGVDDETGGQWIALFRLGCRYRIGVKIIVYEQQHLIFVGTILSLTLHTSVAPLANPRANHSCCPNAAWSFDGSQLTFLTTQAITLPSSSSFSSSSSSSMDGYGIEITHSYLERERWYSCQRRRALLLNSRFFDCHCADCAKGYDAKV